jgi:DNA-binding MarR family transcriptional regulator
LDRREEILARLAAVVDEGRGESARAAECSPLTAEGLAGAAFGIVYARLLREERRPLSELTGELMSLIVLPYMGSAAARRELTRPAAPAESETPEPQLRSDHDPLQGVHMRLTLRTARVLDGIAELPGASNRMVAERAGVTDPGQISKLLRRLEGLELIENSGEGHSKGEPNAWSLTPTGRQVAQSIRSHARHETRRRAA